MPDDAFLDELPAEYRPATPPSWDEIGPQFTKAFPGVDPAYIQKQYEQSRTLALEKQRAALLPEDAGAWLRRRSMPFVSSIQNTIGAINYGQAKQRLAAGAPSEDDYRTIAQHEVQQQRDAEQGKTWVGAGEQLAAHLPAIAGEFYAGGIVSRGVLGGAARLAPEALGFLAPTAEQATATAALPLATRLAGPPAAAAVGRTVLSSAITAGAVPSMWAEQGVQNNLETGRDPMDGRGFAASYTVGAIQLAVMQGVSQGSATGLQKMGIGMQGPGMATFIGRAAASGAAGIPAAQAANLTGYTLGLQTGYGSLEDILKGDYPAAMKHMAGDFVTFGLFHAVHEGLGGTPAQREAAVASAKQNVRGLADVLVEGKRAASPQEMAAVYQNASGRLQQLMEANPNPTRADVAKLAGDFPDRLEGRWLKQVASFFPEKAPPSPPEAQQPPEKAPPGPPGAETAPSPTPAAPAAPEGQEGAPGSRPQLAGVTDAQLRGAFKDVGLDNTGSRARLEQLASNLDDAAFERVAEGIRKRGGSLGASPPVVGQPAPGITPHGAETPAGQVTIPAAEPTDQPASLPAAGKDPWGPTQPTLPIERAKPAVPVEQGGKPAVESSMTEARAQDAYDAYVKRGMSPEAALAHLRQTFPHLQDWTPAGAKPPVDVLSAFDKLDRGHNLVSLVDLRKELADQGMIDRAEQDKALLALRGKELTFSGHEGRKGITPEERAAALPGEDGGALGYVSRRAAEPAPKARIGLKERMAQKGLKPQVEPGVAAGEERVETPEQKRARLAGFKEPELPAEEAPSAPRVTEREMILDRIDRGEGDLDEEEKQVLRERLLNATSFKELEAQTGINYQTAKNREVSALKKLGIDQTVDEIHLQGREAQKIVEETARGKELVDSDMHLLDPRGQVRGARINQLLDAHKAMDELYAEQKALKKKGKLTPAKEAKHDAELRRLRAIIEAGEKPGGPAATEPEKSAAPEAPVAEPPPETPAATGGAETSRGKLVHGELTKEQYDKLTPYQQQAYDDWQMHVAFSGGDTNEDPVMRARQNNDIGLSDFSIYEEPKTDEGYQRLRTYALDVVQQTATEEPGSLSHEQGEAELEQLGAKKGKDGRWTLEKGGRSWDLGATVETPSEGMDTPEETGQAPTSGWGQTQGDEPGGVEWEDLTDRHSDRFQGTPQEAVDYLMRAWPDTGEKRTVVVREPEGKDFYRLIGDKGTPIKVDGETEGYRHVVTVTEPTGQARRYVLEIGSRATGLPHDAETHNFVRVSPEAGQSAGGFFRGGPSGGGGGPPRPPVPADLVRPGIVDDMKKLLAPGTRSEQARVGGGIFRESLAAMARAREVAQAALAQAERHFEATITNAPNEAMRESRFLDITDVIEGGKINRLPAELQPFAQTMRDLIDQRTDAVRSRGLVQSFIDNYMGHLWQKPGSNLAPEAIAQILNARRSLAGREGFRKQRTLPTYRDGIEAGLEPVDWNPARLVLRTLEQVDKSVMAHDTLSELHDNGMWQYVRLGGKVPEGMSRLNDKAAVVFAPPETQVREYFDRQQMEGLEGFASKLGIDVKTLMSGGEIGRAGVAGGLPPPPGSTGKTVGASFGDAILRRFGTPEEILAHELGHQIDARYHLQQWLYNTPALKGELEQLADLRASGRVSKDYQDYLRSPEEAVANLIAAKLHAPELLKQIAPRASARLDQLIRQNPELQPLETIKPSLELGQRDQMLRLAGPMLVGHYYTPQPVAEILENYLTPSILPPHMANVVRGFGNLLNQFQLGFSAFHAGFVAMDTQVSAVALGLQEMSRGDFSKGLGRIALSPLAPFRSFTEGSKVMKEYYQPGSQGGETAALVDQLVRAGGRARMDAFYTNNHVDAFRKALETVRARGADPKATGSLLLHALPALAEASSKPVLEAMVPRMKLGVFAEMARSELARLGPGADVNTQRAALGKVWDSVENRLGQLTYDNLFWNRTVKDTLMIGLRSVGWNVGTWREIGGGFKDVPSSMRGIFKGEGISPRVAYVVALPMVAALYGAIYQYLRTGKGPEELKDVFFPKTGLTRKDGSADRVSLPSYMRDVAALTNRADEGPFKVAQNMWTMAKHKLNPGLETAAEMLDNEDFYGAAIRNPNDSAVQQSWDTVKHLLGAFEPLASRNIRRQLQQGASPAAAAQSLVGVTPAPAYITESEAQQRAKEMKPYVPSPQQKLKGKK